MSGIDTKRVNSVLILLLSCLLLGFANRPVVGQHPGECIRLKATHPDGVPIHEESHNSFTGQRFAHGAIATITEEAAGGNWLRVRLGLIEGWISVVYVDDVVPCNQGNTPTPAAVIRVGSWNLEYLKEGRKRGFNEFLGTQAIPARTNDDYRKIADIIRQLDLKLVILQEINGVDPDDNDEDAKPRSPELEKLVGLLGSNNYSYEIGSTGGIQRVAFLFDTRTIHIDHVCEADLPSPVVQSKALFDRQPLLAYCQIFADGVEVNDFVAVGLHLASGQQLKKNHDQAIAAVTQWIAESRAQNGCIPAEEFDVIIAGDLNASRFDNHVENFWNTMESGGWDVLADSMAYPSTRLAGNPPGSNESKIDYIIVSRGSGGLAGEEVLAADATVHTELVQAAGGGMAFRRKASDHLPVTIELRVTADND